MAYFIILNIYYLLDTFRVLSASNQTWQVVAHRLSFAHSGELLAGHLIIA